MKVESTHIDGPLIIDPDVYRDDRGYFFEPYNQEKFFDIGISDEFVQDNQSFSKKYVLRGLHFQVFPFAQAKLVRVVSGSVYDVAVDIREGSKTYGKYVAVWLSGETNRMFYIPEGFAHGFLVVEDAIFQYKCSNVYSKEHDSGLRWNDPTLNIDWVGMNQMDKFIISEKDKNNQLFKDFKTPF